MMIRPNSDSRPSFERVYRAYFEFVWRTLRALGVTDSAVDDAAQDVFVVVHRRLDDFEGRASIKTWLYEIARRVGMRYRSRAANDAVRTFELPDLRSSDDLEAAVDQAIAAEVLRSFIATLDEDRRRVFVLAEFWEMRGHEIADALDVNMNTVYARLRSARIELHRMTRRLQARNARALTKAMRASRPPARAKERTWAAVVATVGGHSGLTTGAAATSWLASGISKWIAVGGVVGLLGVTTVAAVGEPQQSAVETARPSARVQDRRDAAVQASAPVQRQESPSARPETSPDAVQPEREVAAEPAAAPRPRPRVTHESSAPSLKDQLERLRVIRTAIGAEEDVKARAAIDSYRRAFPDGALRPEIDALEVELACRVSPEDVAARELEAFRRQRARSHLIDRLERICARKIGPQNTASPGTHQL
jgi:RNA polymerase sigma factor (sigma-70 family)